MFETRVLISGVQGFSLLGSRGCPPNNLFFLFFPPQAAGGGREKVGPQPPDPQAKGYSPLQPPFPGGLKQGEHTFSKFAMAHDQAKGFSTLQ
jgi:hypothetical protein